MQKKYPLVSINILTYNSEKYVKNCLNSALGQAYPNLEILVIDNNSTDSTIKYLKSFWENKKDEIKNIKLRLIFNPKNVGFAAGHNQGIRESRGDFVFCLNHDVVLDNYFVANAVEILEKDKKIAAVQGKLLRWNTGRNELSTFSSSVSYLIDTTGLSILKNRRIINQNQGELDQGQFEEAKEIFGADGAAPIYRREALEDVKINGEYFDESFFAYKEDVDLAWRLRLFGWKAFYQPKSIAWHDRTAGDSAAINYLGILKERLKISKFAKELAFKNQRLTQIKNEQWRILIKHFPYFITKEISSWIFVMTFEIKSWRAITSLFKEMPQACRKRKIIMKKKRLKDKDMEKWFV